jgi:alpha-L-rhamnosidase
MKIAYRYTFSGKGVETWRPQFTYNGFRYLKVEGLTAAPKPAEITVDTVHASNPEASTFTSSNPLLQQIQEMTHRAIQSNMMSVLTDCPDREKGPYTGDNLHNIDALLANYDLSSYEPQLVRNMATAQRQPGDDEPGLIANIAPEFHRVALVIALPPGMTKRPPPSTGNSAPPPSMPDFANMTFLYEVNWGGAVIRIPWRLYQTYGDTRTMARYYGNMVAWMDFLAGMKAAHHGDIPGLGDWSAADRSTPMELPILAGYYSSLDELSKIAGVLGKSADQEKYANEALKAANEFNDRFRKTDDKGVYYGSGSEASNALALDAGLVPEADRKAVLDRLIASIAAANDHITTGSVALGPLFRVLQAAGRNDLLYKMVTNPTSPGYGYLAAAGFTTLAESLSGFGSNNHHFLGEVDAWLMSGLAGIRQAQGSIGYREIEIVPGIVDGLASASGSYSTPFGDVRSEWTKSAQGAVRLQVDIPAGTTALIHVPVKPGGSVQATGQGASASPADRKDGEWVYRVTPGHITFVSE